MQQEREKKRQAGGGIVSSFHPRGGVFCCSWRDGADLFFFGVGRGGVIFPRRDGAVVVFFRGGTGRLLFFSEAGRGGFFFFFQRDGTGRCFFLFSRAGTGRLFLAVAFFWRDGAKSLHRPAKGGLNRPASRPCKALEFLGLKNLRCLVWLNRLIETLL